MAKKVLQVTDFSGGLNAYADARDIDDSDFVQNWNAVVDRGGIIRVAGMGLDETLTEDWDNYNFEEGFGLFQFSADYPFLYIQDGNLDYAYKSGVLTDYTSGGPTVALEAGSQVATNAYANYIIYFPQYAYSQKIVSNTDASPTVITVGAAFRTSNGTLSNTASYRIYRWTPSASWKGGVDGDYLYISNYTNTSQSSSWWGPKFTNENDDISDGTSAYRGHLSYTPKLTLIPGVEYKIEFHHKAQSTHSFILNPADDGEEFSFNLSTDGGSGYGVAKCSAYVYCYAPETGTYGSTLTVDAAYDLPTGSAGAGGSNRQELMTALGNGADEDGFGILRLYTPASTTFMKMWTSHTVSHSATDQIRFIMTSGYTLSGTSAVDAVRFEASSGNFDGKVKMYGIK